MPIEIRELVIKVNVNQQAKAAGDQQNATKGTSASKENNEALIKECVEQVLLILDNKKER